jgi:secernin
MCDTFVALGNSTATGSVLLAKNADTEINEAQHLVRLPQREYGTGASVRTTHIVIPQVPVTPEVILNKSFWTWGAEIGFNEYGVAVGNEAVFSNQPSEGDGLTVIDFLRLILERSTNCDEAVDTVAQLLAEFGQGGNCELRGNSHFDGGFLVSDQQGAVVIQTAGKQWASHRVEDIASISNVHSIRNNWDRSSLAADGEKVDFRQAFSDETKVYCAGSDERQQASFRFLEEKKGQITVRTMADLLRYTGEGSYDPMDGDRPTRICMHAGPYENRLWQATGALISEAQDGVVMGWATATSGPDVSIFKPVFCGVDLPDMGPMPRETYTEGAFWWRHEILHRRAMAEYHAVKPEIRAEFDQLEDSFFAEGRLVMFGSRQEKQKFVNECWQRAHEATDRWIKKLEQRPYKITNQAYRQMWDRFNRAAALTLV